MFIGTAREASGNNFISNHTVTRMTFAGYDPAGSTAFVFLHAVTEDGGGFGPHDHRDNFNGEFAFSAPSTPETGIPQLPFAICSCPKIGRRVHFFGDFSLAVAYRVRKSDTVMASTAFKTSPKPGTATFPRVEVEKVLRKALSKVAADAAVMKDPWEPQLDSLAVVKVVICIEEVLPGVKIAPEKVVKKGGYATVDEGIADMVDRIERQWQRAK